MTDLTRRTFIIGSAASAAAAALTNCTSRPTNDDAKTTSPPRYASTDGVLTVALTASAQRVDLAGRQAYLYAFNGRVPEPVMETQAGDEVRLHLRNVLAEPTNLHFHGLHVSPAGTADNVFIRIPAGEALDYAFRIPTRHPAGLFWVHPHLHGLVAKQVSSGLAAPFIIRGEVDRIPEVAAAREHLLIAVRWE